MRVLVTGACGFLGSHVVEHLLPDHRVYGIDNLSTGRREWWFGNERDLEVDTFEAHTCEPEAIVHCAAVADISQNWRDSRLRRRLFETNVESLVNMLECLPASPCKHFILISTAAVDAPQTSPYVASKIAGEAFCRAYCDHYKIPLTIIRPVSMLGERYHHGHVRDFVRMAIDNGRIQALDNGSQHKPYNHVAVVARTVRTCLKSPEHYEIRGGNIVVPGMSWSIGQTIARIRQLMKRDIAVRLGDTDRGWPGDPDVNHFIDGDARDFIDETIEWCIRDLESAR